MSNYAIAPNYRAKKNLKDLADLGLVQGDILYYDGTDLGKLSIGSAGQVLVVNTGGTAPEWSTPSGGGDVSGPSSSTDNAIVRFDGTTGKLIQDSGVIIDDTGNINIPSGAEYQIDGSPLSASDIPVITLGTPTYSTVQDWLMVSQSAGKISGGDITDNSDGTVKVSAGTGFIKITNSDTGETKFFDWAEKSSLSLTDSSPNYVYVEYNSGSPQVVASTSSPTDKNTNILLGIVYKDGNDLYITTAGQVVSNYAQKTLWKDIYVNGKFQRINGIILSETGTRNIHITSGLFYAGLTKVNFPEFDSSGTDTFTYFYRSSGSGWTKETGKTQIDKLHYDDGSGTLAELSDQSGWRSYYGVHWVYATIDGSVFVVYGQDDYLLSDAENAQPPSSLPGVIESVGMLIGKIVIKKGSDTFESVKSAFDTYFVPHVVANHNELAGIQGGTSDEYYHLTESEHTKATQFASSSQDGLLSSTDWNTFNNKQDALSFPLSADKGGTGLDTSGSTGIPKIASGVWSIDATQDDLPDGTTYKRYNPASVNITGGSITGITDLAVADGGTGASDAATARTNLGIDKATLGYMTDLIDDTSPQLGGDLDANSHKITNLSDPTNDQDAATKKYVDDNAGGGADPFSLTEDYFHIRVKDSDTQTGNTGTINIKSVLTSLEVGNTSNSYASLKTEIGFYGYHKKMKLRVWIRNLYAYSGTKVYFYAFANDYANSATKYIGIRVEGSTAYFVSKDGSSETSVNITSYLTLGLNTNQNVIITFDPGVNAKCYINGSLAGTITTHLPPSNDTTTGIHMISARVENNTSSSSAWIYFAYPHGYREL